MAGNASSVDLKLEGELECQVCLGDRQIHKKCLTTEQPDSDLMGLNWLDDAPETVTRINSKTKADPQPINTKKDIIKCRCPTRKAYHQTPMVETVIANMEITGILTHSTRNEPATAVVLSLVRERLESSAEPEELLVSSSKFCSGWG